MPGIGELVFNPTEQHAFIFRARAQKGEPQPAPIGEAHDAGPEIERFRLALKLDADDGIRLDGLGHVDNAASAKAEVHGVRTGLNAVNRLEYAHTPGDGVSRGSASFAEWLAVVWGTFTRVRGHL